MSKSQQDESRRVLVALDGSPAAQAALPVARTIARQLHARLAMLYVATREEVDLPAEALWQRLDLPADLGAVDLSAVTGDPVTAILAMIDDPRVLLTVLTTHGRTIERKRHLGHVAEAVIATTTRPVLLVRPEAVGPHAPAVAMLRCMLFPLDGTPSTAGGFRPAADLACEFQATVDVLYVADPAEPRPQEIGSISMPRYTDQPQHEWPAWVSDVVERLGAGVQCPENVPVHVYLAYGHIEDEIIRFAIIHHEDLIVLVRHSHLETGHARVLRAVLDHTPCPVLLMGMSSVVGDEPDGASEAMRRDPQVVP